MVLTLAGMLECVIVDNKLVLVSRIRTVAARSAVIFQKLYRQSVYKWLQLITVIMVMGAWIFVQVRAAQSDGTVFDEVYFVTRGITMLRTGDMRLVNNDPPFLGLIQALPSSYRSDVVLPLANQSWEEADEYWFSLEFLYWFGNDSDALIYRARLATIALVSVLPLFVWLWATKLGGWQTGIIALLLIVLDPNLAAHAHLATTDAGVTTLMFVAAYGWHYLSQTGAKRYVVLAGLALGAGLASKYTSTLMTLPLLASAVFVASLHSRRWVRMLVAFLTAAFVVWSVFGLQVGQLFDSSLYFPGDRYFEIFAKAVGEKSQGHRSFLFGNISEVGWWYYFVAAFLVKTPIPTIVGSLLGIWLFFKMKGWRSNLIIIVVPVVYFFSLMPKPFNIGYRHMLPILPFVYVVMALAVKKLIDQYRYIRLPAIGILLWMVNSFLSTYPHYLAYFNEFVGGPEYGYRYLVDSNLDWGQDINGLAEYVANNDSVNVSYFGSASLGSYGIKKEKIENLPYFQPMSPYPGTYAISVTHLQGIFVDDPNVYDWFRHVDPIDKIGYSIHIYEVPEERGTVQVCADPSPVMVRDTVLDVFGERAQRIGFFDCSASWILPSNSGPTWYVFRGPLSDYTLWALGEYGAKVVFEQPHLVHPEDAYSLYRVDDASTRYSDRGFDSSVHNSTFELVTESGEIQPVARFLGANFPSKIAAGEYHSVQTAWRIISPPERQISTFVHLMEQNGNLLIGSDGMGVPVSEWSSGDIILQRAVMDIPATIMTGDYLLRIGLYSLVDMQRLISDGQDGLTLGVVSTYP